MFQETVHLGKMARRNLILESLGCWITCFQAQSMASACLPSPPLPRPQPSPRSTQPIGVLP